MASIADVPTTEELRAAYRVLTYLMNGAKVYAGSYPYLDGARKFVGEYLIEHTGASNR